MSRLRQRLLVQALEDRTAPAVFTVQNLNDTGADSLRQCVINANNAVGADTIQFKAGLSGFLDLISGQIQITGTGALTITGPGPLAIFITGNNTNRIFNTSNAAAGTAIALSGMSFTASVGEAILAADEQLIFSNCKFLNNKGTAVEITNSGTLNATDCEFSNSGTAGLFLYGSAGAKLTLTRCTISGNDAGGVYMPEGGTLNATDSLFSGNSTSLSGGAINVTSYFFGYSSSVTLTRCTISNNKAGSGGGLFVDGDLLVDGCTVSGNTATAGFSSTGGGGGLRLSNYYDSNAVFTIRNSTISGNSSSRGGGIYLRPFNTTLTVQNSTITGNTAGRGGGIYNYSFSGTIALNSSIVSGNTATLFATDVYSDSKVTMSFSAVGSNAGFTMTDLGGNLPFQPHANLKLGPLANNGGPTQTHMLAITSPCLDKGNNSLGLTTDQRGTGFPRLSGAAPDIGAVELSSLIVTNLNDSGPGSLRQAVLDANSKSGTDTIDFVPGLAGTITLTSGEIVISQGVTFQGPGSSVLSISGNNASRIFDVSSAPAASGIVFSGLTLTGGFGSGFSSSGGAIRGTSQSLQVMACVFSSNKSAGTFNGIGGAIVLTAGTLTATNSSFTGNIASTRGGALAIQGTGSNLILNGCTVSGNSSGDGGGVYVNSGLSVQNSTISGNIASGGGGSESGGGILAFGPFAAGIMIVNSTFSGNSAFSGGGIALNNTISTTNLTIRNSTITANSAGNLGGGIARMTGVATIAIESSIVAGNVNVTAPDISSAGSVSVKTSAVGSALGFTKTDLGGNLAFGTNLKLGPLANNGGVTLTHLPAIDSPVVNAGSNPASLKTDQRGFARVVGAGADIGAVELQPEVLSLVTNIVTVSDANVGPDGFIVTATYNIPMNTTVLPTVAFPVEMPGGSLTFTSGSWTNSTTFVAKFQVADLGVTLSNIDLQISGGKEPATNIAPVPFTVVDAFHLDTQNPLITSITSTTPNGTYSAGQSVNVTLNFSEAVTLNGTLFVVLDTAAVVSIAGPVTGATLSGTYVVSAGQSSPDLNVTTIALTSGSTLRDAATNNAVLALPTANLADTSNIVIAATPTVTGFTVNDGDAQRSRLTKVVVNFSSLVNAATLAGPGGVTFTRTTGAPTGTVVDTTNGLIVNPVSGMVPSVTLTFANVINAGVESGSLADGRWQMAIPSSNFTSPLNDLNLFRLFGDADGDGTVAANDFIQFRLALGGSTAMFDFDGDSAVAASDFIQFRLRFGGSI